MAARRPKIPQVPLPVWRDLLAAALAFKAAKPWQWLDDCDVFALIDDDGRPWFPSVLGAAGRVFGLVLYRGETGLRFLLETSKHLEDSPQDALYAQDALMMDWGSKNALSPEELKVLAEIGHQPKTRERNAWPCYRSHSPGLFPWHLDEPEARALAAGIRAALACAELARADSDFLAPRDLDETLLPTVTMAATREGNLLPVQVEWRTWLLPPPPSPVAVAVPPDWSELRLRPLKSGLMLEFDIFHTMMPTLDGDRPYFPRVGLVADSKSGFVYAVDMAGPTRPWADLVISVWHKVLFNLRERPGAIAIRRPEWVHALSPLTENLGIKLLVVDELPFIDEARDAILQKFGGGGRPAH
jgi:hypothetical protein